MNNNLDPINTQRFVGWKDTVEALGETYKYLFLPKTISMISEKITQHLEGVDKDGRNIIYPDKYIRQILGLIFYQFQRPNIGDIRTKDIIPPNQPRDDLNFIINQTISFIVKSIRIELEMVQNNKKLSIWDSVLGDFNRKGLRAHPILKIRKKRPQPMMFNMNY